MRVLFVVHDFLPRHASGTEVYTGQLALRLRERGHEPHVFAAEKDVGRADRSLARRQWDAVQVHELVNNLFYEDFRETWDWPPAAEAFGRVLDELRPDVVHVMHLLYLSIGCVEEAHRRGIPVVYTLHDFWLMCARFGQLLHPDGSLCERIDFERCGTCLTSLKFAQTPFERRTARVLARLHALSGLDLAPAARRAAGLLQRARPPARTVVARGPTDASRRMAAAMAERERSIRERLVPRVDLFVAPSRYLMERFLAWGLPAERVEHLEYGLELDPFRGRPAGRRAAPGAGAVRVAFLGTLAPHKGPHLLLEAWRRLAPEARARGRLVLYGGGHDPAYLAHLEAQAEAAGAELAGRLEREGVPAALAETDLLVVPSVWFENSPLSIHEALATGVPLAVSDLGGMAELVEDGRTGWRFRAGDAEDLARVLADVLRDPGRLAALERRPVKDMRDSARELEERYAALAAAGGGA